MRPPIITAIRLMAINPENDDRDRLDACLASLKETSRRRHAGSPWCWRAVVLLVEYVMAWCLFVYVYVLVK